ncbi:MAG: mechanosensitive ion channel [Ilumatobacteraceae bacterium]|jgi:small conductance mechanosensitive channel|nr:mechanosensitive ion channel [Ilumatobacteraceae bacterium]
MPSLPPPLVVVIVLLGAVVLTRVTGLLVRRAVRRVADQSLVAPTGRWRTRTARRGEDSVELGEQRRRQRIDAASRMINHLVSVVIWLVAVIVVFHTLDLDAAFFISSAGFVGAAIAIGGQHKVNDYLTGLAVHVEDRYGVGDEIVVETGLREPVQGVVDHIGLFSTRLRDGASAVHLSNGSMSQVRNLSQEAAATKLRLRVEGQGPDEVAETLKVLAGSAQLTDVIFVGDIESHQPATGEVEVEVRTSRPLDGRASDMLVARAERALRGG